MADCLRRELLYSEKRPRDLLFRAVEQILGEGGRELILVGLTREAAKRARWQAEAAGVAFRHWETAARAAVKAMLGAGVLLDGDGQSIRPGITAHAAPVARLRERYQDLTEAYLIEFVIRRLGDVTTRDHMALAHALFRQFDQSVPVDEMEDRVVILLAQLAGRVGLRGDTYFVREIQSQ